MRGLFTLKLIATLKLIKNLGQVCPFCSLTNMPVQQCGFWFRSQECRGTSFFTGLKIVIYLEDGEDGG